MARIADRIWKVERRLRGMGTAHVKPNDLPGMVTVPIGLDQRGRALAWMHVSLEDAML